MYLQPLKNDDPQLDFYTMYKRETDEYDNVYIQKYNEDLNTTLIFVCSSFPVTSMHADYNPRPACSPPSAPPSSSASNPSLSQTTSQSTGQKPTFERSYSASIHPFLPARPPALLLRGADHPRSMSQLWV